MNQEEGKRTPNVQLAEALSLAKKAGTDDIIQHSELTRAVRERLVDAGCLIEIIRGWYLLTQPDGAGTSTAWFGGFWAFAKRYLTDRFEKFGYCLSAESSLGIHAGENCITKQITVMTKKTSNSVVDLPHETSLVLYTEEKNFPEKVDRFNGVNIMPLALSLCRLTPTYFHENPLNVEIALKLVPSVSEISRILLTSQAISSANRIAGAYKAIGEEKKEIQFVKVMEAAGYSVKPKNPFVNDYKFLSVPSRLTSPYTVRIEALWKKMRNDVVQNFPIAPGLASNSDKPIKIIRELYKKDAYHSLSIEGYQVTEDLIKKIAAGEWDPTKNKSDKDQIDALAARGYLNAFNLVLEGVVKVLKEHKSAAKISEENLQGWYRELFSPSVQSGLLPAAALAGYRNQQVYINMSRHVPPPHGAVLDSMETLFSLLRDEENVAVKAILGHFIFVYIHPYMDGNGRIGRLLMNLMLVSGGYHWTVVRTGERSEYLESLESASTKNDIIPFTKFIAKEMSYWSTQKTN